MVITAPKAQTFCNPTKLSPRFLSQFKFMQHVNYSSAQFAKRSEVVAREAQRFLCSGGQVYFWARQSSGVTFRKQAPWGLPYWEINVVKDFALLAIFTFMYMKKVVSRTSQNSFRGVKFKAHDCKEKKQSRLLWLSWAAHYKSFCRWLFQKLETRRTAPEQDWWDSAIQLELCEPSNMLTI